ncbi:MAG: CoA transferase [Solirubrobacteraceae bacterium]|nr:CoA transferase [Solirubrobacteraceae bacterium]
MDTPPRPRPPVRPGAPGPLAGIRVLDFSRLFAGPLASMTLADLGAQVVKVEAPGGDEARHFGPPFLGGEGMNYMALGRGKRSVVIDLKTAEGRSRAQQLARRADVVIENFRPGVTERLGIDYETLREENEGLVYCSITGFGPDGPYRDRPAFDLILQGMGGVMARQGGVGDPRLMVVTVADTYCASLATQGILAALYARAVDGLGQLVQADLFQAILYAQAYRMVTAADEIELSAWGDVAPYGPFHAADGWFNLAIATDRNFVRLCEALERPELAGDARFATNPARVEHQEVLAAELTDTFSAEPAAHWLSLLEASGVPCGPILDVEDLFTDPHLVARGGIVELEHPTAGTIWTIGSPFSLSRTPLSIGAPAPCLGEHTDEVLAELSAPAGAGRDGEPE